MVVMLTTQVERGRVCRSLLQRNGVVLKPQNQDFWCFWCKLKYREYRKGRKNLFTINIVKNTIIKIPNITHLQYVTQNGKRKRVQCADKVVRKEVFL